MDKIMHRPIPGPVYWDYRCITCSEPVRDHASLIALIVHAVRKRSAHV